MHSEIIPSVKSFFFTDTVYKNLIDFDRKIEISDPESLKKLIAIMAADPPQQTSPCMFTYKDRERSDELLC